MCFHYCSKYEYWLCKCWTRYVCSYLRGFESIWIRGLGSGAGSAGVNAAVRGIEGIMSAPGPQIKKPGPVTKRAAFTDGEWLVAIGKNGG